LDSVLGFIHNGGIMMYPLILCSIVLVAIAIERIISLRKLSVDGDELLDRIKGVYTPGQDPAEAIKIATATGGSIGRIFARGLRNSGRPESSIEQAMEQESANEVPTLEANMPVIRTIVNIAPLLGLLGTIAGMIASFRSAAQTGLSNPTQILGGISEALVSTATGITLAVVGFIVFNYLATFARKVEEDIDYYGTELLNYMTGRVLD
jgi:biopolymer transport protein ExbB